MSGKKYISKIKKGSDDIYIKDTEAQQNKADKVASATSGHLASLDSNGNLADSGYSAASFDASGSASAAETAAKAYADSLIVGGVKYKGTVNGTTNPLPTTGYKKGNLYVVSVAGTYAGKACEVGDWLLANKNYASGATAANDWDAVSGENQVTDQNASLTIGTAIKVATVDGTDIHVTQVEDMTKIEAVAVADTTEYADVTSLFTAPANN